MVDIKITLETLYDILRNEKKREDLQKLEDTFFVDVVAYLREKHSLLDTKTTDLGLFASGEKEKLEYELRSIKRILKQIYELREKKIIDIAINKSRTGSDIIDTSSMLRVEKDFYHYTLKTLDHYRRGILLQLFKAELPDVSDTLVLPTRRIDEGMLSLSSLKELKQNKQVLVEHPLSTSLSEISLNGKSVEPKVDLKPLELKPLESKYLEQKASPGTSSEPKSSDLKLPDIKSSDAKLSEGRLSEQLSGVKPESTFRKFLHSDLEVKKDNGEKKEMIKVRFIHPVPSFIWKDMKEYGPFDVGEFTEIFPEVADLLVRKGRAEKV